MTLNTVKNAFFWRPEPKQPTEQELKREMHRLSTARTRAKQKAMRVNPETNIGRSTSGEKTDQLKRGNSVVGTGRTKDSAMSAEKTKPATAMNCAGF